MQIEIKETIPLHDEKGFLIKEGWSRRPYWQYDRKKIKSNKFRIKEWDYYAVISQKNEYGVAITISDLGYIGYCSITFLDFKNKSYHTDDSLFLLPLGRLNLPSNSTEGFIKYEDKKIKIAVESNHSQKKIHFYSKNIEGNLILNVPINEDSICIATSWKENRKAFYYNQKINCIKVNGKMQFKNKSYEFDEKTDLAVLDWGRGVWTYKNRWYWSSLSAYINNKRFGWNFGYGFSDRSKATENALFYDGKLYKLDLVKFYYNSKNYLEQWKILDNQGKVEIHFLPIMDRYSKSDFVLIKSIQHQVFGYFSGKVMLEDNQILYFDHLLGFAEEVYNVW